MSDLGIEQQLREVNAALIVSSIHQHELAETALKAERAIRERDKRLSDEAQSLSRLNEASSRLWRAKTMQEGLNEILNSVVTLLGADMGSIRMVNTTTGSPTTIAHKGFAAASLGIFADISGRNDDPQDLLNRKRGHVVIDDVDAPEVAESIRVHARKAGYRAFLSTPIVAHDGSFLGLLSTYFSSARRTRDQDLRRLDLYVRQAAAFIVRHQTEEALGRELEATRQLQQLGALIIGEDDLSDLFTKIVRTASMLMDSNCASLQVLDEGRGELHMVATFGLTDEFSRRFEWEGRNDNTTCAMALNSGRRVVAPDISTFEGIVGTPAGDLQLSLGIRAAQSTPLISRSGQLLGMITTQWSRPHAASEREFRLMDLLARQAADLIDRKQYDDALIKSESLRRQALDAANLGTWNIDPVTSLFTSDDRFRVIFGSTVKGLNREEAIANMHPDDQSRVTDAVMAAMCPKSRAPYDIEYRVVLADGSTKWVLAKGGAGFVDEGMDAKLVSFAGTVEDITYRKEVEEALLESEERFKFMAESMPQKIFTANPRGEFTYFNPQWLELTGLSFEVMRSSGWDRFVHPDELQDNLKIWEDSIETGKAFQVEHRILVADGKSENRKSLFGPPIRLYSMAVGVLGR